MADIVSEIAAASSEQATGIEEINAAVVQMDEMTQQNSALVEESAAAARSLQGLSQQMSELMNFFKLDNQIAGKAPSASASRRPEHGGARKNARPKPGGGNGAIPPPKLATASDGAGDENWEEF